MAAGVSVAKNENGKRGRNQMDTEDAEFAPLSKRINNLHLHQHQGHSSRQHIVTTNGSVSHGENPEYAESSYGSMNGSGISHMNGHYSRSQTHHNNHDGHNGSIYNGRAESMMPNSSGGHQSISLPSSRVNDIQGLSNNHQEANYNPENGMCHRDYRPALDPNTNPHYYESNKQLYMLYLERMSRTGQRLHPHFYE